MSDVATLLATLVQARHELRQAGVRTAPLEVERALDLAHRFERLEDLIRDNAPALEDRKDPQALTVFESRLQFDLARLRDSTQDEAESTAEAWVRALDERCEALELSTFRALQRAPAGGGGAERWP